MYHLSKDNANDSEGDRIKMMVDKDNISDDDDDDDDRNSKKFHLHVVV